MARRPLAATPSQHGLLAQVARHAKVSAGTVSRAFNNSTLIPTKTRVRVLDAARELGFRPRVGVRNKQIALVTEPPRKTVMGGYVNTMTQYIVFALSRADAGMTMITEDRVDHLANLWFDGVIGVAWEPRTVRIIETLPNVPVVWLSDEHDDRFRCVCFDPVATGRLAGDYLCGHGHQTIALLRQDDYTDIGRREGLRQAMAGHGLDPSRRCLDLDLSMPMHLAMKRILDARATAVWVTGEDLKVLEVGWVLQELAGKRIPGDISLLGFENPGISEFARPSLTTVCCPKREMAEKAVALVLGGEDGLPPKTVLPVHVIERASVGPPPA